VEQVIVYPDLEQEQMISFKQSLMQMVIKIKFI
jgi:hypothetical protein